jgi:hypothetical protein
MATIRPPVLTEDDLGPVGWRTLFELASRRRREPRQQILSLVQYALARALAGDDVELTDSQLKRLFDVVDNGQLVAA